MACNYLGLFASGATSCSDVPSVPIYGDSINLGETLYYDSGCTIEIDGGDYTDNVVFLTYRASSGGVLDITSCLSSGCSTSYCISNTGMYDGVYDIMQQHIMGMIILPEIHHQHIISIITPDQPQVGVYQLFWTVLVCCLVSPLVWIIVLLLS